MALSGSWTVSLRKPPAPCLSFPIPRTTVVMLSLFSRVPEGLQPSKATETLRRDARAHKHPPGIFGIVFQQLASPSSPGLTGGDEAHTSSFVIKSPFPFSAWVQGMQSCAVLVSCKDPGPQTAACAGGSTSTGCWTPSRTTSCRKQSFTLPKPAPHSPCALGSDLTGNMLSC